MSPTLGGWNASNLCQDVLINDELGYIPVEADAENLYFQPVSRRYEHGSIIVASNLAFPIGCRDTWERSVLCIRSRQWCEGCSTGTESHLRQDLRR